MALPASYTEESLKAFMLTATERIATVIKFTADKFADAVNETLVAYGTDDIAEATDVKKLRALARVEAWRAMVDATTGEFDYSADSGQTATHYKRSQLHDHALKAFARAEAEAVKDGYTDSTATGGSASTASTSITLQAVF